MIFNSQGDAKLRQYINGQTITPGDTAITLPKGAQLLGDVTIAAVDTEILEVTPTAEQQIIIPPAGKYFSKGIIGAADTEAAYQEGYNAALDKMNTILLLHGESLADSSLYNRAITNNGVKVSTAQKKFGTSSLYFNGSSGLRISPHNFGSEDFTIDWWEYPTISTAGTRFASIYAPSYSTQAGGLLLYPYESGLTLAASSGTTGTSGTGWNLLMKTNVDSNITNKWTHRAVVRKNNQLKLFRNGVLTNTFSLTAALGCNANLPMAIGEWTTGLPQDYFFTGYIDEFHISNVARWENNFTPPTEQYQI